MDEPLQFVTLSLTVPGLVVFQHHWTDQHSSSLAYRHPPLRFRGR